MPGLFDAIRDFFSDMFGGGDDDNEEGDFSWGGVGGESDSSWGGDLGDPEYFSEDIGGLEERLIDEPSDEFVQEFYDIDSLIEYLEGTPESVLKFYIDPEEEVYYVYRFDS